MEDSLCTICLKGVAMVDKQRQSRCSLSTSSPRPTTQDVGSLCKLLMQRPPLPELEESLIHDQDGNNCSLCSTCAELIQEMKQIRYQISQLQNQFGKRIVLVRNMILQSDVKRLEKLLHLDEMEKLREIRQILLRLAGSDDNFVTSHEVQVKVEPEDVDFFQDDPLSQQGPSSPSSFLLHPEHEDAIVFKNEEEGGDSDNSFSINPHSHKRRKLNLRRSGRSTTKIKTENEKNKKTTLPKEKTLSSEPNMKSKRKIISPPKKKRRLIKHSSPTISDSDTEIYDDDPGDDPEFDPLQMLENNTKIEKSQKTKLKSTKNLPHKCSHCSKGFTTEETLSRHVQQNHSHNCQNCDESFNFRSHLEAHHKTEHPNIPLLQCTICKKEYSNKYYLEEHMVIRHETEDKVFFCDKCNKGFSLEVNLQRHVDLHNVEDVKPLVCEICDSRFSDQTRLDKHAASHDQPTMCDICSKLCSNSAVLARHRRTHTGEKPFKCDHCDETFIDRQAKKYHTGKVHSTPDQHHLCPICGKTFFDFNNLKIHIARHNGTLLVGCDQCEEKFKDHGVLQSHKVDKHGADRVICEECGATFKSAYGLAKHKKIHGERRHTCDICKARFLKKQILAAHMRRHTGERPFPCSECDLKFKSKKNLTVHVKKIHTPDYIIPTPHACSYPGCGKRFQYKSGMDNHFRQVHTTERPFVCEICNTGCATRSFLSLHKKSAHGIHVPVTEGGGKLPKSKRQFPSTNFDNSDFNKTAGRRIKKRISNLNPRPPSSSCTTSDSEPPTQFDLRGDANINRNSNIPPVFQNPSYFSNYYHL